MTKTDLFQGLAGGVSAAVCGPPGTGKSTLLGSCGHLGNAKLLATKPREANSWKYRETGITANAELFFDAGWRPSADRYEATGFVRLIQRLGELYDDDTLDFVLLDPFTDVVQLAANEILKVEKAATPRDMRDPMSFYGALKYRLKEVVQGLTVLQYAPKPKHVLVSVHTQPAKEESRGGTTAADKLAHGVEYEGKVLPAIEGAYRREFAGEFDIVLFSDIRITKKLTPGKPPQEIIEYVLQAQPDNDKHAKSILGPVVTEKFIPNDFATLLTLLQAPPRGTPK